MRYFKINFVLSLWMVAAVTVNAQPNDFIYAWWNTNDMGNWTNSALWSPLPGGNPLPAPGFPGTNWMAHVVVGNPQITDTNILVSILQIEVGSTTTVDNAYSLTCTNGLNPQPVEHGQGCLEVENGYANILNVSTATVNDLSIDLGTSSTSGYLDLGGIWGGTSYPNNFGTLNNVGIYLRKGGLRVDANSISMVQNCVVSNKGQEVVFHGDWLNPDGTTTLVVDGYSAGGININGNFSFGGCILQGILDTSGISLVKVGGNAVITNATLKIGATDSFSGTGNNYDLIRVPSDKNIQTNGLHASAIVTNGLQCAVSIDENRSGYDYLVITPTNYVPVTTITNPVPGSMYSTGDNINIFATASDKDGAIDKVEFFINGLKVGEDASAPYSHLWTNVLAGGYEIQVKATDNHGSMGVSGIFYLGVQGANPDGTYTFVAVDSNSSIVITFDALCVAGPWDDVDDDKDGMLNGWEAQHGFNPYDPSDASGDADSDGLTNLQEYQRGTDPNDPNSRYIIIYVNDNTGNDEWDGYAPAWDETHGPKKRIIAGIETALTGDTIEVAEGTYTNEPAIYDLGNKSLILVPVGSVVID